MKIKYLVFYFMMFHAGNKIFAQSFMAKEISFQTFFNGADLRFNTFYKMGNGDSLMFETCRFYISGIELLENNKIIWKEENSFHLIDASEEKTMHVSLKLPNDISYNKIKFNLGVDSLTNSQGALGGDLDPTKGMYWTWQNGYINFKLEGRSNLCQTRNNEFQYHVGGYQFPFNAMQTVTLPVSFQEKINIVIDLEQLMEKVDLLKQSHIMSPGLDAVLFAGNASSVFRMLKK